MDKKNTVLIHVFVYSIVFCQNQFAQEKVVYKSIDSISLTMEIYTPEKEKLQGKYPAIVFFFGGGWINGNVSQFAPHAKYFSKRGMVTVLVDYRVFSRHNTSPFESLADAKSAIRFLRLNADRFHIDPSRIVASGGSAGGQLAAAAAVIEKFSDPKDNTNISAKPDALILFNPVIDNGPGGYGYDRIGEEYHSFSPLHNLKSPAPPTILFLGTNDELVPVETAQYFKKVIEKIGGRCDLHLYEGQTHGFFNAKHQKYYKETLLRADEFLVSIGFIERL